MSDIVERLDRASGIRSDGDAKCMIDAKAEIERLRAALDRAGETREAIVEISHAAVNEIERLRAVIEEYLEWCGPDRDTSEPMLLRIRANMRKVMLLPTPGRKTG